MADTPLPDDEPEEDLSLFPVTYAVPERIPKHEVDAFMAAHPERELKFMPFELAREKVAAYYFLENERRLKHVTLDERDKYHLALAALEKRIDNEKNSEDAGRVNYRRRKDELADAMQGPLTQAGGEIALQHAKALSEVDRMLSVGEKEKKQEDKQKEFEGFLRNVVQGFNQENKE